MTNWIRAGSEMPPCEARVPLMFVDSSSLKLCTLERCVESSELKTIGGGGGLMVYLTSRKRSRQKITGNVAEAWNRAPQQPWLVCKFFKRASRENEQRSGVQGRCI